MDRIHFSKDEWNRGEMRDETDSVDYQEGLMKSYRNSFRNHLLLSGLLSSMSLYAGSLTIRSLLNGSIGKMIYLPLMTAFILATTLVSFYEIKEINDDMRKFNKQKL